MKKKNDDTVSQGFGGKRPSGEDFNAFEKDVRPKGQQSRLGELHAMTLNNAFQSILWFAKIAF